MATYEITVKVNLDTEEAMQKLAQMREQLGELRTHTVLSPPSCLCEHGQSCLDRCPDCAAPVGKDPR